ncbi:MAG: FkbM family methyltransferase [Leptolyngbyaceae cyanobacterium]
MKSLMKRLLPSWVIQILRVINAQMFLVSSRRARYGVGKVDSDWRIRIDDVVSSPDNAEIPRCHNAGEMDGYTITMHNGVRVSANGYYGDGFLNMLIENRGVHEPQEERVFEAIIQLLPEDCSMLELGAYWAFYSLSLLQQRPNAKCYLVEPDPVNLLSGKINFRLNNRQGYFKQAGVDCKPRKNPKMISIDSFCREHRIEHLNILHADIQGCELAMLDGAREMLSEGKVDFVFISTHSNSLHTDCLERLISLGYMILAEVDLDETFSVDGLIVAKYHSLDQPKPIKISRKSELLKSKMN